MSRTARTSPDALRERDTERSRTSGRSLSHRSPRCRVDGVAQRVADEVDRRSSSTTSTTAGNDEQPWPGGRRGVPVREQQCPATRRAAERRTRRSSAPSRQDIAPTPSVASMISSEATLGMMCRRDDRPGVEPHVARRLHEVAVAQGAGLGADDLGHDHPAEHGEEEHHDDPVDRLLRTGTEQDQDEEGRQHQHQVDEPADDACPPSARGSRRMTRRRPRAGASGPGDETDDE